MKILFAITEEKADGVWGPPKNVAGSGDTPADCREDAIAKAEAAAGEGSITRSFLTLGTIDIE